MKTDDIVSFTDQKYKIQTNNWPNSSKIQTNNGPKSSKIQIANQNKVRGSIIKSCCHDSPPKWAYHPISKRISTICEITQWIE
jgi:hypothetical protein